MRRGIAVGALVLAGVLGLSLWSFWLAVRPPRSAMLQSPAEYGLTVENVSIPTDDGLRLAAWFLPRPGAPAVVMLHGYPTDKGDMLSLAAALAPQFAVLMVDQRYFGASEGRVTTLGHRERRDLARAIDFLAGRGAAAVGVFGLSLGGAVAIMTAAEDPRIGAVAVYAPFSDLQILGGELYARFGPLGAPFVGMMRLWACLFLGADITRPSPAQAARVLRIPVLLVHSRQDDQIAFTHAERLREALRDNPRARFLFLDRGRHGDLGEGFERRLREFFAQSLP